MSTLITLLLAGASLPAALAQEGQSDQGDESALVVQNSQDAVAFIDQNGKAATCESFTLIAAEPAADGPILLAGDGWYVVQGQVNATRRIEVHGNAHLILCDNARLIAERGIHSADESTLSIFEQTQHTGKLEATGNEQNAGIGGTVAIRGGTIEAQAGAPNKQPRRSHRAWQRLGWRQHDRALRRSHGPARLASRRRRCHNWRGGPARFRQNGARAA